MRVGITGITGFVGSRVKKAAQEAGFQTVGFSRGAGAKFHRQFSLDQPLDCNGLDAVVHLAGEPILGLWTQSKKERIRNSRIQGTQQVVEGLRRANPRPQALVCASAVGYYGDTGESDCLEHSPRGNGFLAEVTAAWEEVALRAEEFGVRTIFLRIGFVLGQGGALAFIAPIFRLGMGGCLGSGKQWMSGIHVDDVAGMAVWALQNPDLRGPVNAVMPEPFRNKEFTLALAKTLRRPAVLPVPSFALRFFLGELSHVMLDNCKVRPGVATARGFSHQYSDLHSALAGIEL